MSIAVAPPGTYIDLHALIGDHCRIARNVWVGPDVQIGNNCVIGPGTVIGWDGFGYAYKDGYWEPKPQSCGVVIEDDVHIHANVCIDRGSYRDTFIGEGTRIDNLVHVAHNVRIGRNCVVVAQAMLAGSSEYGDGCYIAPCAAVREHREVGAGAFVGLGAVVVKDVEDGQKVMGVPAKPF